MGGWDKLAKKVQAGEDIFSESAKEAKKLNEAGELYRKQGDYKIALSHYKKSLSMCQEAGNKEGEGRVFSNMALVYSEQEDYETALSYIKKALQSSEEADDQENLCTTLFYMGYLYRQINEIQKAVNALLASYKIAKENNYVQTMQGLTQFAQQEGLLNDDIDWGKLAQLNELQRFTEVGENHKVAELSSTARNHMERGNYDAALSCLAKALTICTETGDKIGEGAILHNISQINLARGNFWAARSNAQLSLSFAQESGDKAGEGITLNTLAQIYMEQNNHDIALSYLQKARVLQEEIGDLEGYCETLFNIGRVYKRDGMEKSAFETWVSSYQIAA